ncbi:MAG: sigma-54-dependent Fis family transcriptional regulator [Planctomycetaceae bacterium]|nr:sigma-54-dependent Fis family transcriptional regulator [Planctomycetales bacterium]MCB9924442.1 sigma-54-dependent Fis family transcriptional regulator [Planctomycetaceae bacterium]
MSAPIPPRILLVDDDQASRETLREWFEQQGWEAVAVRDGEAALEQLHEGIAVIVTDLKMPRTDGMELLRLAKQQAPHAAVIMVSGVGSVEFAVEALKEGAYDFLSKPINLKELTHRIEQALEKRSMAAEIADLHRRLREQHGIDEMIGQCPAMRELFEKIRLVADTNSTVLVIGESGTGKELVARSLHLNSPRRGKSFLPINCAAIPDTLIESELFGHEKGAFTGASDKRKGVFQAAEGGTLFIDEIGEMPLGLQSKLLRAIENKKIMPVGSSHEIPVDIRLIAATNRDLEEGVRSKEFREDLYYRLKVVVLRIPPLRDRRDDIPLLVRFFIDQIASEANRRVRDITPAAMDALRKYEWPGNVRELRNTLEGIIVLSLKEQIDLDDVPPHIRDAKCRTSKDIFEAGMTLQEMEREAIRRALEITNGHRGETAQRLGVSVRTLQRKVKEYDLAPDE